MSTELFTTQHKIQLEFTLDSIVVSKYSIKGSTKAIQSELTIVLEW